MLARIRLNSLSGASLADQEQPPQGPPAPPPDGQSNLPGMGGSDGGNKNLIPVNIEDEMQRSYLDYAMSVIIGRALPHMRDGLKPGHGAIPFCISQMGFTLT